VFDLRLVFDTANSYQQLICCGERDSRNV
jgi:hypothetical protein